MNPYEFIFLIYLDSERDELNCFFLIKGSFVAST